MPETQSEVIHITLSHSNLSDDYNQHAAALISSVLDNCTRRVSIHYLYEDRICAITSEEAQENINKFKSIIRKYDAEIHFHAVTLPEWVYSSNRENLRYFTPGTLLRLYLPKILPPEIEKIIYLDCDMIVKTDLTKLWDVPIENYSLAACLDAARKSNVRYYSDVHKPFGISIDKYFNAGFLILNLKQFRETEQIPDKVMELLYKHPELPYLDQDVLNILFQNETYFISQRYNLPSGKRMTDYKLLRKLGIKEGNYEDCILHYCGRVKPWNAYSGVVDEEYWKYLRMTPWKDIADTEYMRVKSVKGSLTDKIMNTRANTLFRTFHSLLLRLKRNLK